nr:2-oxo acid dehydrogenase subunit E2 [Candidatus Thiosymbion oneisti]
MGERSYYWYILALRVGRGRDRYLENGGSRIGLGPSQHRRAPAWGRASLSLRNHRILPLSLSYDHRVVDSAEVVCFTDLLREDIRSLLL